MDQDLYGGNSLRLTGRPPQLWTFLKVKDIPEGKGTFSQSKHSERLAVGLGMAGLDCSVILPALEKNAFPVPSW